MGRVHRSNALAVAQRVAPLIGALSLGAVGAAQAGSSAGCGCVPTSHTVRVPGVSVSPPSVTVDIPTINYGAATANSSSNSSASSSASASTGVSVSTSTSSGVNTQAIINGQSAGYGGGGGGGGSWSESGGVTTTIDSIKVETPVETRRVCAAFKQVVKMIAIQASCLDDKSIPHPASQLSPEREVADGYEGEVYRCIAGARMQYTIADYGGQANFDHGQTLTCNKGEALYHTAAGLLQCRPQKPARDCNERSLLRRFGAGIKVLKISRADVCAAWKTETVEASVGQ
jgi:hypothetical protein